MNNDPSKIANFFWHGRPLGIVEICSLNSFISNGFSVRLFCYESVSVPYGVELVDASTVVPRNRLYSFTQQGKQGNLAAFSDYFRYRIQDLGLGWWFDLDVICLKPVIQWQNLYFSKDNIVCGYEDKVKINGAVLFIKNKKILEEIFRRIDKIGNSFPWGEIGPRLISSVIEDSGIDANPERPSSFYPISYKDYLLLYDPDSYSKCIELTEQAFALHVWNEVGARLCIPNYLFPPSGSYLNEILSSYCEVNSQEVPYSLVLRSSEYLRLIELERALNSIFRFKMIKKCVLWILGFLRKR